MPTLKDTLERIISFQPIDKKFESKLTLKPIQAAKIKGRPLPKIHRAFIYGGVGNMSMPTSRIYYEHRSHWCSFVPRTWLRRVIF